MSLSRVGARDELAARVRDWFTRGTGAEVGGRRTGSQQRAIDEITETLAEDYIRTARAKGLSEARVVIHHALANAAVPIVTVIGIGIALLIGGVVVTETVYAIPGLGRLTVDAVLARDFPTIQGVILFFSFAYVLINLLVDLSYLFFDPRIRY